jgi:hypothetical protein
MARPATRQQLKDYCLRQLGEPVTKVNVDDAQVEDCIDDALQYFSEYHFDGVERTFIRHELTDDERAAGISSGYVDLPVNDAVTSIAEVLKLSHTFIDGMFSVEYQMALNDITEMKFLDLTTYQMRKDHLATIDKMLNPVVRYEFSRVKNAIRIYLDDRSIDDAKFIVYDAFVVLDPETYGEIYNDILLKKYATALIMRQWGQNLSKYDQVQLPGGITLNGQAIKQEALDTIQRLEETIQLRYEEPPMGFVG